MTDSNSQAKGAEAGPPASQEVIELAEEYAMDNALAEDLRQAFRDAKRAAPQHKRLMLLLHGLARKPESDAQHVVEEITRAARAVRQSAS
ncbi:MAG TPA: hypothetical protein VGW38_11050 [Chloroflexota bacterium]|nr:hypothetical protein [Chloroflexota bacterium]